MTVLFNFLCFGVLSSTGCALMELCDKGDNRQVPRYHGDLALKKADELGNYRFQSRYHK